MGFEKTLKAAGTPRGEKSTNYVSLASCDFFHASR